MFQLDGSGETVIIFEKGNRSKPVRTVAGREQMFETVLYFSFILI